jgi:2-polyprenyl-6-methoxyphenol hydroxylase-like FAD-dependent oxidoreductase
VGQPAGGGSRLDVLVHEVLVVGAGPTGLTAAGQLVTQDVNVRIIERRRERAESRAFVMHPRTLELLRPLGVTEELLERGRTSARVEIHCGRRVRHARLAPAELDDTAFPFLLMIPQVVIEQVLEARLRDLGVAVEREVELIGLTQQPSRVDYTTGALGRTQHASAEYVLGCDGADSTVRSIAAIPFAARGYRSFLVVADIDIEDELARDSLHVYVAGAGVMFLFPSPDRAAWRLLVAGPQAVQREPGDGQQVGAEVLQALIGPYARGSLNVRAVHWSSHVRLRRGQAGSYRRGRLILAGDAAHLHSPAGAQGMNTGMHDAGNVAWKLAMVLRMATPEALLDSYPAERASVARRTRQLTDLVFLAEAGGPPPLQLLRAHASPWLLPLLRDRALPAPLFRLLGGLATRYRRSPVVLDAAEPTRPGPHAGDRLPDGRVICDGRSGWLHQFAVSTAHTLLLCGPPDDFDPRQLERLAETERRSLPLRMVHLAASGHPGVLCDVHGALFDRLGILDAGSFVVRPDGFIAFRSRGSSLQSVDRYLTTLRQTGTALTHPDKGPWHGRDAAAATRAIAADTDRALPHRPHRAVSRGTGQVIWHSPPRSAIPPLRCGPHTP